jgi:hypothetical protein
VLRLETRGDNNDHPSDADTLACVVLCLCDGVHPGARADRPCVYDWGAHDLVMGLGVEVATHSYAFQKKRRQSLESADLTSRRRVGPGFVSAFPSDLVCTLNVFLHFALLPYMSEPRRLSRVFSDSRVFRCRR